MTAASASARAADVLTSPIDEVYAAIGLLTLSDAADPRLRRALVQVLERGSELQERIRKLLDPRVAGRGAMGGGGVGLRLVDEVLAILAAHDSPSSCGDQRVDTAPGLTIAPGAVLASVQVYQMAILTAGAMVREAREDRGLTREQLALKVRTSTSTITRLEREDKVPKSRFWFG